MSSAAEKLEPQFIIEKLIENKQINFQQNISAVNSERFGIVDSVWQALTSDPMLNAALDQYIQDKVNVRLETQLEAKFNSLKEVVKAEAWASGENEGRTQGQKIFEVKCNEYSEAILSVRNDVMPKFNAFINSVVESKKNLLIEHEKEWMKGLVHVINKFMLNVPEFSLSKIHTWLKENTIQFPSGRKIRLFVSEKDYSYLIKIFNESDFTDFEILKDETLTVGNIRSDYGVGGVFYSRSKEFEKLENILNECIKNESESVC